MSTRPTCARQRRETGRDAGKNSGLRSTPSRRGSRRLRLGCAVGAKDSPSRRRRGGRRRSQRRRRCRLRSRGSWPPTHASLLVPRGDLGEPPSHARPGAARQERRAVVAEDRRADAAPGIRVRVRETVHGRGGAEERERRVERSCLEQHAHGERASLLVGAKRHEGEAYRGRVGVSSGGSCGMLVVRPARRSPPRGYLTPCRSRRSTPLA